jgi:hypothetical protein
VERHVPQQHHAGVLAVDLARMDAGLDQQHGLVGIELLAVLGDVEHQQVAALGRLAEASMRISGEAASSFSSQARVSA